MNLGTSSNIEETYSFYPNSIRHTKFEIKMINWTFGLNSHSEATTSGLDMRVWERRYLALMSGI